MSVLDEILTANAAYAHEFKRSGLPMPPARKLAVLTCMDARIHPEQALGLEVGDAHMIRNAGGRIVDAIRSLIVSQTLLGTEALAIIHHTDCGMLTFTDSSIRSMLRDERGLNADAVAFLAFTDLQQSVVDDVAVYRASPLLRQDIVVRGFLYDVNSGRLQEVD